MEHKSIKRKRLDLMSEIDAVKKQRQDKFEADVENIEETVLRLHVYLIRLATDNGSFETSRKKIEEAGKSAFTEKDKQEVSLWAEHYKYYEGKFMAYIVALEAMQRMEVPNLIKRLRHMNFDLAKNTVSSKLNKITNDNV